MFAFDFELTLNYDHVYMKKAATNHKLLIIEDEEYLLDLYVEVLSSEGFTVDRASDGNEGYEAMKKGGYDLVLLDVMLPKMDGFQILEKLTNHPPAEPNKGVLILSNLGKDAHVAKGISFGVRGYLVKAELTPDQLVQEVKSYLQK